MRVLSLLIGFVLLTWSSVSYSQQQAPSERIARGKVVTLCNAQAAQASGVCDVGGDNTGNDDYFIVSQDYTQFSFYLVASDVDNTCTIYGSYGDEVLDGDLSDNNGFDLIGSPLSNSNPFAAVEAPVSYIWADCFVDTAATTTVKVELGDFTTRSSGR